MVSERLTVLPHVARSVSVQHHLRAIGISQRGPVREVQSERSSQRGPVREVLRSGRRSKVTDGPQVAHP